MNLYVSRYPGTIFFQQIVIRFLQKKIFIEKDERLKELKEEQSGSDRSVSPCPPSLPFRAPPQPPLPPPEPTTAQPVVPKLDPKDISVQKNHGTDSSSSSSSSETVERNEKLFDGVVAENVNDQQLEKVDDPNEKRNVQIESQTKDESSSGQQVKWDDDVFDSSHCNANIVGSNAMVFSLNNQVGGLVRALRVFQVRSLLLF